MPRQRALVVETSPLDGHANPVAGDVEARTLPRHAPTWGGPYAAHEMDCAPADEGRGLLPHARRTGLSARETRPRGTDR
eukprot:11222837-Lingulodinium_polyedra.AAC.1